jgi:thioesterase-3
MRTPVLQVPMQGLRITVKPVYRYGSRTAYIRFESRNREAAFPVPDRFVVKDPHLRIDPVDQITAAPGITHQKKALKPAQLRRSNAIGTVMLQPDLKQVQSLLERRRLNLIQIDRLRWARQARIAQCHDLWKLCGHAAKLTRPPGALSPCALDTKSMGCRTIPLINRSLESLLKVEYPVTVQEQHTDELGHLNHVQAVKLMEDARGDWYARCGQPVFDPAGYGTVVVNIDYNYRGECFLGEKLTILTVPVKLGRTSFVLSHQILKADRSNPFDGLATCLIMDMKTRQAIPVPDWIAEHFPTRA